jgi:hypothetical protein
VHASVGVQAYFAGELRGQDDACRTCLFQRDAELLKLFGFEEHDTGLLMIRLIVMTGVVFLRIDVFSLVLTRLGIRAAGR